MKGTYKKILIPKTSRYLAAMKQQGILRYWGQVDENKMYWFVYIEILHQLSSLIVENFLHCLLVEMTLAKNWCAK